jgi:hypothetical protein
MQAVTCFTSATMTASFVTSSAERAKFRVLTDCDTDISRLKHVIEAE